MSTKSQKRALPPTPTASTKYTNVSDAIQSLLDTTYEGLSERERRWYNDLSNCQKTLEQKDSTINNLKTIVMEWKKKAIEYENAYKETQQRLEDREQFLIKQHKAEIKAMTKVQVDQTNDNLDIIMQLEKENQLLRQQLDCQNTPLLQSQQQQQQQFPNSFHHHHTSTTTQLCNNAEIANKAANDIVSSSKENSDELIQRINDMVNAMEGTLHDFKNNATMYHHEEEDTTVTDSPPALISDSSSCCSSDDSSTEEHSPPHHLEIQPSITTPLPKKKRSSTIPNFLFRSNTKKKYLQDVKRNQSLNESNNNWVQRKPIRTTSILSSNS